MERDSFQFGGEKILIVDDSLETLQILSETLSEYGYRVQSVVSGSMALRAVKSAPPDLILLDIDMPEIDGYQVCQRLKASKITSDIPIIFLTAKAREAEQQALKALGAMGIIVKPFSPETIATKAKKILGWKN